MKYVVPICALLTLSCTAIMDGEKQPVPTTSGPATSNPDPMNNGTAGSATTPQTAGAPFLVRQGEPELLPFDVRVRRIANALNVALTNPMFAEMEANSIKLGDYDHAQGVLPDGLWIARRIAGWADVLTPVCGSSEMKAAYPALPEKLPELVKAAWGRALTPEELTEFQTAASESGLEPALSYEATCMAVFTAAEFVYR